MIIERIERPNAQPIIQPSRSKLERQAANDARPRPSGYVCGACGEQHCDCRPDTADAGGVEMLAGMLGICALVLIGIVSVALTVHLIARVAT